MRVWLFLRGRDARLLLDYILDRAQLAFVVGRETSNTCQGFRLKALSSLTSAPCKKCLIDRYLLHENTRTNAHAYILCFSKFYYAFIYREKKQNVNSSHSCGQIRPFFFYHISKRLRQSAHRWDNFHPKYFSHTSTWHQPQNADCFCFSSVRGGVGGVGGWDELQLDRKEDMNESNKLSCKHLLHNFQLMTEQTTVDYLRRSTTCETTHNGFISRLKVCLI